MERNIEHEFIRTNSDGEFMWVGDARGLTQQVSLEDLVVWLVKNRYALVKNAIEQVEFSAKLNDPAGAAGFSPWDEIGNGGRS